MKRKITVSESELKKMVLEAVQSLVGGQDGDGVRITLDRMSQWTLENDGDEQLNESNNWIMKRRSWDINDFDRFFDIVEKTPRHLKGFLTQHSPEEIRSGKWITYTLKGHDVCFALHYISDGQVEICNVCNNSDLKGIGREVVSFARNEGGVQLDHFMGVNGDPGKLGRLYNSVGLDKETWHDKFNPAFQPEDDDWKLDTDMFGEPDVRGLESSRHRKRYNNPNSGYRQKYDARMRDKFNLDDGTAAE